MIKQQESEYTKLLKQKLNEAEKNLAQIEQAYEDLYEDLTRIEQAYEDLFADYLLKTQSSKPSLLKTLIAESKTF